MEPEHITTSTRDPEEWPSACSGGWPTSSGPGSDPVITEVSSPESNGMSSETLLFTAAWNEDGAAGRPTAWWPASSPPATDYPVFTTYDLDMQFRVMRLVRDHTSVPVPETFWYEPDPTVLGGPFFVMARVDGLVPPDVLPYTFGDNWVFDGDATPTGAPSRSRPWPPWPASTPSPRTEHDLSFLELGRARGRTRSSAASTTGGPTTTGWSRTDRRPCWPTASPGWRTTCPPT